MTNSGSSRAKLIRRRWLSVTSCGLVSAAVAECARLGMGARCDAFIAEVARTVPGTLTVVAAPILGYAIWLTGHGRWRGWLGLRHLRNFPPLWVAVIIGLFAWTAGHFALGDTDRIRHVGADLGWYGKGLADTFWIPILGTLLGCAVVWVRRRSTTTATDATKLDDQNSTVPADFEGIRRWLLDDDPVRTKDADRFSHQPIASRIATRLRLEATPTIALIGPLGSGKSTIRCLVEENLSSSPHIRVVNISLWPFDSPESAVRGILSAVVRELGSHVNTLSLQGLPDEYVAAIENSVGVTGAFMRLLRPSMDPSEIVDGIRDVVLATGLRLVVWIEDLERFSGGDQLDAADRARHEFERLGPIRALLFLLDQCSGISVVIADVSLRSRFEIGKLARFIETVPSIDVSSAARDLKTVREACLGGYPKAVIDAASANVRGRMDLGADVSVLHRWLSRVRSEIPSLPEAIIAMLATPRSLKSSLRVAIELWEAMAGEIDFDCVLAFSALKTAHPDLFAVIAEDLELFQFGLNDPLQMDPNRHRPKHAVEGTVEKLLDHMTPNARVACETVLRYLFPAFRACETSGKSISQPQALDAVRHVDYARRFLSQSAPPEQDSDQAALRSIRAWISREESDLIERIMDERRCMQIENFVGQFSPSELLQLLEQVAARLSAMSAATWNQAVGPGIASVWRMLVARPPSTSEADGVITGLVEHYAATHLPLAQCVGHLFAEGNSNVTPLLSGKGRQQVVECLAKILPKYFTTVDGGERLVESLKEGSPWLVFWLAWGYERNRKDDFNGLPFPEWPTFSSVLLDICESRPDIGVPLVVPFVTDSGISHRLPPGEQDQGAASSLWRASFGLERATRLFEIGRLLPVLKEATIADGLAAQMKLSIAAAKAAATDILAKPVDDSAAP